MKLHTSNNREIHSNYISLQEIKYHRRFQCSSVFRGFENRPPAVLHTWTLPLQKYPIPTALFVKI